MLVQGYTPEPDGDDDEPKCVFCAIVLALAICLIIYGALWFAPDIWLALQASTGVDHG